MGKGWEAVQKLINAQLKEIVKYYFNKKPAGLSSMLKSDLLILVKKLMDPPAD